MPLFVPDFSRFKNTTPFITPLNVVYSHVFDKSLFLFTQSKTYLRLKNGVIETHTIDTGDTTSNFVVTSRAVFNGYLYVSAYRASARNKVFRTKDGIDWEPFDAYPHANGYVAPLLCASNGFLCVVDRVGTEARIGARFYDGVNLSAPIFSPESTYINTLTDNIPQLPRFNYTRTAGFVLACTTNTGQNSSIAFISPNGMTIKTIGAINDEIIYGVSEIGDTLVGYFTRLSTQPPRFNKVFAITKDLEKMDDLSGEISTFTTARIISVNVGVGGLYYAATTDGKVYVLENKKFAQISCSSDSLSYPELCCNSEYNGRMYFGGFANKLNRTL